ncbi:CinA family protein [Thermasporomyces composti]|jgi:nicotinamide-nucleotide amidase|uniref:Competence/damage-inducible protein cinA n=1 Tax=Thermasporomyces composti TaxID=696763 RepID=A0A3D9VCS7_THECX|nr:CinA family protein [Thermasporomyces composti]REF35101.1 competence/damage-inducible protein cinA [Thermasporomyces composti]
MTGATTSADESAELAAWCHERLLAAGRTVATAESLTGGLLGAALTARAGSSRIYRGGVVAYASDLKVSLLGVSAAELERHGPVHPRTAQAMAVGVRDRLGATYGLATTGVAGPEPHGGQPVGTVDLACAGPGETVVRRYQLSGDRQAVRRAAVVAALELLREVLIRTTG